MSSPLRAVAASQVACRSVTNTALEEGLLVAAGLLSGESIPRRQEDPVSRRTTGLALVAILALAACGSSKPTTGAQSAPPVSSTTLPAGAPTRIVSLSPTATEMLFAIGAGAQV